ncbi:A disintegrin and metalloproteinase with thrombospondin motifs 7 isoform X2 [Paramormyrops kingsleyae]|uniref:A disintegrin and metalloproteinase with thrombospondin motifs 7 isoform X2 n=1 Tax=Paramormyrops kingsleyae TaxID=1676925 RepID=UPI003B975193
MRVFAAEERRCPGNIKVAAGIFAMLENDKTFGLAHTQEDILQGLLEYEVVHPTRVDLAGRFVSNFVSHRVSRLRRRDTSWTVGAPEQVFYHLQYGDQDLNLNLTLNPYLLAPGFLTERRYGGLEGTKIHTRSHSLCYFIGEAWGASSGKGHAAISTCDGLTGLFKLSGEEFFIRPLEQARWGGLPQPHVVYKRHAAQPWKVLAHPLPSGGQVNGTCGLKDVGRAAERAEQRRERWEKRQRRRKIRTRSVSREKWVETLVVADPKMVEYHGIQNVESYVLAVMNIVAGLFRDASIGNSINIVVVRLILLEKDEEDLKISHHADNSLSSFCKWQKRLNTRGDQHPVHHDVAVLLTRKDICAAINKPCETLGLSHVSGMCQSHRSCSISEDTGLPLAFTVAHELGHNFGIQHDGNGNDCEPIGKRPFIMSPQLLYGSSPPNWSRCSRQYITRFLDRGWGWCLDDAPGPNNYTLTSLLPGVLYSASHQCQLQYGSGSLLCDDVDNVCSTLWCTVGETCHSRLDGAVDGTKCGEDKWCYGGECVSAGHWPERVDGGWGPWSEWSACSRTCSTGVQDAQRDCNSPIPKHGGKYCLGERRRYRTCQGNPCPADGPPFRLVQCSHFNNMPYKGKFYTWVHVNNRVNPCELHCRPLNEYFSEKMLDAVIDGTQCYEGSSNRDICINGICKSIGCDFKIDSEAVEDRCGVCRGNGSTCETVKKTFEESEGRGYVDVGVIPEGARDIRIEEMAEAGNFLALRSNDPDKYFLNGGWTIQWNGEYKAAGTVFTYERTGHLENVTSPGPTLEPVWIQLLFQETNPGVRYEYTISREALAGSDNNIVPEFQWKYGPWTECSATCGTGVRRQPVLCVEQTSGTVEEHFCDLTTRPDDKQATCNEGICPAIWWLGEWHKCSASCGHSGLARRAVLCIQSVGLEEQKALQPSECQHLPRPESVTSCNTHIPCPADWTAGSWTECSATCGRGVQGRTVACSNNTGVACDPGKKPKEEMPCQMQDCPPVLDGFGNEWSGSGSSSKEVFSDTNSIPDDNHMPGSEQGTTRAHPARPAGDMNNIIDEGFSQQNHIDHAAANYIRNNVQIDDFYYDYNFIGFHEDLSDVFGEGEGLEIDRNEGPAGPGTVMSVHLGSSTKPPTSTSHKPTATPEDANYIVTTPHSIDNKRPKTTAVRDLENTEDHGGEKRGEDSENEEEILYAEDHFLPVSVTPPAHISNIRLTEKWKEDHSSPGSGREAPTEGGLTPADTLGSTAKTGAASKVNAEVEGSDADADTRNHWDFASDVSKFVTEGERNVADHFDSGPPESDRGWSDADNWKGTDPGDQEGWESISPSQEAPPSSPPTVIHFETNQDNVLSSRPAPLSQAPPSQTPPATTLNYDVRSTDSTETHSLGIFTGEDESGQYYPTESIEYDVTDSQHPGTSQPIPRDLLYVPTDFSDLAAESESKDLEDASESPVTEAASTVPKAGDIFSTTTPDTTIMTEPSDATPTESDTQAPATGSGWDYTTAIGPPGGATSPLPHQSHDVTGPNWLTPSLSPPPQADTTAYWAAGNWSTCSTTCGLGAIWRSVWCSTGRNSDCLPSLRPVPARRCYIRPCSSWRVGEWSRCSRNCSQGVRQREVQCTDTRDRRPLRPFHCQAIGPRPHSREACNPHDCMEWFTTSWGQCSELCGGGGEQQRLVTCPEPGKCDEAVQPNIIQACNSQPCAQWVTGSWGQCSAPCGGGVQRRLVKCVDIRKEQRQGSVEEEEEEEPPQCEHSAWPEDTQKCNVEECSAMQHSTEEEVSGPAVTTLLTQSLAIHPFAMWVAFLYMAQIYSSGISKVLSISLLPYVVQYFFKGLHGKFS